MAYLPALKWLTDTGTQPFCKIMLANIVMEIENQIKVTESSQTA